VRFATMAIGVFLVTAGLARSATLCAAVGKP
jgi:hypothetical protein